MGVWLGWYCRGRRDPGADPARDFAVPTQEHQGCDEKQTRAERDNHETVDPLACCARRAVKGIIRRAYRIAVPPPDLISGVGGISMRRFRHPHHSRPVAGVRALR
jgi:hypothetical protein